VIAKSADTLTDAATANKATSTAEVLTNSNRAADVNDAAKAPDPRGLLRTELEGKWYRWCLQKSESTA
jgi:hypothetical protein